MLFLIIQDFEKTIEQLNFFLDLNYLQIIEQNFFRSSQDLCFPDNRLGRSVHMKHCFLINLLIRSQSSSHRDKQ